MKRLLGIALIVSSFVTGCGGNCQTYQSGVVAYCGRCGSHCIICMHNKWESDPCNPHCDNCGSHNIIRMRERDYYEMKRRKASNR